jgi:outer membrane murein-binding lipoprotein Lpp
MRRKPPPVVQSEPDPLAEQVAALVARVEQLERDLAAFKQKVASNINLAD